MLLSLGAYRKKPQVIKGSKLPERITKLSDFNGILHLLKGNSRHVRCEVDSLSEQCGMKLISYLDEETKNQQIYEMLSVFFESREIKNENQTISQIIITDVVSSKGRPTIETSVLWKETKIVCIRKKTAGPTTVNPNSGNYIRHFTITPEMLVDIYNFKK